VIKYVGEACWFGDWSSCRSAFSQNCSSLQLCSVFRFSSSSFHFCLIVFLREEVLRGGMVIIPEMLYLIYEGGWDSHPAWSFKLSESSCAIKTSVTGFRLNFVILFWIVVKSETSFRTNISFPPPHPSLPQTQFNTSMGLKKLCGQSGKESVI